MARPGLVVPSNPPRRHELIADDSDRPSAFIRFRTRHATVASTFEPEGVVLLKGKGPSVENAALYVWDNVVKHIGEKFAGRDITYTVEVLIQEPRTTSSSSAGTSPSEAERRLFL